jgi:hypothetical protein
MALQCLYNVPRHHDRTLTVLCGTLIWNATLPDIASPDKSSLLNPQEWLNQFASSHHLPSQQQKQLTLATALV